MKALAGISVGTFVAVLGVGWGFYTWLNSEYARLEAHERLAQRVSSNEVDITYHAALRTYEFFLHQAKKYPNDAEIQRKLREAERRLNELERKRRQ